MRPAASSWVLCALCLATGTAGAHSAQLPDLAAAARAILGPGQGVYVEAADGSVLLAQAAAKAVHPASVSKVPATLALLDTLGPDHRFVTTLAAGGPIAGDTLEGDLVVDSDGDPALVDENALLIAARLNQLGIKRIAGNVRVRGALTFDWHSDPLGEHLRSALSGQVPVAARDAVRALESAPAGADAAGAAAAPAIEFAGLVSAVALHGAPSAAGTASGGRIDAASALSAGTAGAVAPAVRPLLLHRSEPLLALVKSLNDYSNNIFNALAASVGGAAEIERLARAAVPERMRAEIVLDDAAGTDARNRLSPRAAVRLLRALELELTARGHALVDILPVAGIDTGTLHDRFSAPDEVGRLVGKTGTFGDYGASALIGALRTDDRGTVYFAILNHGIPVPEARRRQDRFVGLLLRRLHATRWRYQRDPRPAITRVEVTTAHS